MNPDLPIELIKMIISEVDLKTLINCRLIDRQIAQYIYQTACDYLRLYGFYFAKNVFPIFSAIRKDMAIIYDHSAYLGGENCAIWHYHDTITYTESFTVISSDGQRHLFEITYEYDKQKKRYTEKHIINTNKRTNTYECKKKDGFTHCKQVAIMEQMAYCKTKLILPHIKKTRSTLCSAVCKKINKTYFRGVKDKLYPFCPLNIHMVD